MTFGPPFTGPQHGIMSNSCTAKVSIFALLLSLVVLLTVMPSCGEARHLLAVDIGVDWVKAATLGASAGRSLPVRANVVLNDQANRKSPQCVAFRFVPYSGNDSLRGVERVFAEQAYALEPRFPEQVVCGMSLLAGRRVPLKNTDKKDDDSTEGERDELTAEDIAAMSFSVLPRPPHDTAMIRVVNSKNNGGANMLEFSAEEIVGMYLAYMKQMAERGLDGEPVRHLTVTVPLLASLAHRQSIVDAAAIAGLRTVRVVHGTTAAAAQLSYLNLGQLFSGPGISTTAAAAETLSISEKNAKYVMIYDMGSRRTEVAVYRLTPSKKHLGTITRIAVVVNNNLGGRTFDHCIARYAEEKLFPKATPKPIDPVLNRQTSTPAARRAAISLMRGANNVRERLSVNQEAPLVVQGVADGGAGDFTATISRTTFEKECNDLFDEAVRMRDQAMEQVNETLTSLQNLTRFEVIGGATRMPKLLLRLSDGYGKMVDRTLNGDEAAVVGALYMGAEKANIPFRGFRIVEKLTNDVYFSVSPPLHASAEKVEKEDRSERYLLFAKGSVTVPAVRSLHFKNRTSDFTFSLEDSNRYFVRAVTVYDVKDAVELAQQVPERMRLGKKTNSTNTIVSIDHMNVVVEVTLSDSGIPFVSNAFLQATYTEETPVEIDTANKTDSKDKEATEVETIQDSGEETTQDEPLQQHQGEEEKKEEEEEEEEQVENEEDTGNPVKKHMKEKDDNTTSTTTASSPEGDGFSEEKKSITYFERSFPLHFRPALVSTGVNMNNSEATAARDRLRAFQQIDNERLQRSALRNDIEGLVLHYKSLDAWDKPTQGGEGETQWKSVVTDVSSWLDDVSDDVEVSALQSQYDRLKKLQVG
ncbi:heat shock protein 70 (HSP70) [Trypanosoma theileri]|uniref:Heat shock protein 70 (HSP70) n=1 Tax=Trypanosoma theileri TaxID=67003 RepID=A0A1X0P2S1_9TRYP|nr:heat shock protein 70 (HSP70) [Trypanosoma theileri]ORC91185.1 heat shock protein 70 (HSP70) [Trypanosoma theileri]